MLLKSLGRLKLFFQKVDFLLLLGVIMDDNLWQNLLKSFFKDQNINAFTTKNAEIKVNYAERAICTIKGKIQKYTYSNQTYKYIDALDSTVNAYNKSFHSSIKMVPQDVNETNESKLWKQMYLPQKNDKIKSSKGNMKCYKYEAGDTVRISFLKKTFQK